MAVVFSSLGLPIDESNVRDYLFPERFASSYKHVCVKAPSQPCGFECKELNRKRDRFSHLGTGCVHMSKLSWRSRHKGFEWPRTIYNLSSCHMHTTETHIAISHPTLPVPCIASSMCASAWNVNVPNPSPPSSWNLKHHGHFPTAGSSQVYGGETSSHTDRMMFGQDVFE